MKRFLAGLAFAATYAGIACAHSLPIEDGVVRAVDHELFGWHHLPMTLLLIVIGVALFHSRRRSQRGL
jgi:hypothetical protein